MLFTSIEFLFLFLPAVLAGYYLLPFRWNLKNYFLLVASLGFYAWGEPKFVFAMLASIAFNYIAALVIERSRGTRDPTVPSSPSPVPRSPVPVKMALAVAVAGNLALIGVWKYCNFVTATLREWFPSWQGAIPQTSFLLPIGISFFTFQALSYVVDVYRGERAQRNPLILALYIALFPQLIAGPIVRYTTVRDQLTVRRTTWDQFTSGVFRFVVGFNKKMLIANLMAEVADKAFAGAPGSVAFAWYGALCYTFQIYFDFSGYSDMAIGLGRMFGFEFLENFNYPYVSKTVTEFWRRWHMSLGSWFRDYVYFPLGGSRVGRGRLVFNLAVVWFLTGLWHGANWTFILWGCLYGVLITGEKLSGWVQKVERSFALRLFYQPFAMVMVVLGWVLFRAPSIGAAGHHLAAMFGAAPLVDGPAVFWSREMVVPFACAVVGSAPVLKARLLDRVWLSVPGYAVQFALFIVSISCLVMNAHNPFIYFNF
jgi:D-alanyl-lipoteichoic acid acyltransferase DltB (MBOAT superfamily)